MSNCSLFSSALKCLSSGGLHKGLYISGLKDYLWTAPVSLNVGILQYFCHALYTRMYIVIGRKATVGGQID